MVPEQDTGAMDRSRRNTTSEADARQEAEAQIQPSQEQEQPTTSTTQLPRGIGQPAQTDLEAEPPATSPSTPAPIEGPSAPPSRRDRAIVPPITKHTLSELDVTKIIHNSKLRHDINFDPELHFRPNVEGEKGNRKAKRARLFWDTLKCQLVEFMTDPADFYGRFGENDDWCLPVLLRTVKEILETLVPQRDREFLDEGLSVDLLMQQFYRGVLDLEKLAEWLARVLKSHCAPMRDEDVDTMHRLVRDGNRDGNLDALVHGLTKLLQVLESMKLDVANHQIRCLRPVLIQDTIHFEQRSFYKKLDSGRLNIDFSKAWYQDAKRKYAAQPARGFGDMSVLFEGLSRLALPSASGCKIPETLQHDQERLLKFRMEMLDAINLDICMQLYHKLERLPSQQSASRFPGLQDEDASGSSMRALSGEFDLSAPASGSRPSSLFNSGGSDSSSPRSSQALPAYVAMNQYEAKERAHDLYNALVALLYSAPPSADQITRWHSIAPSMAIEIFRYLDAPAGILPEVENQLMATLSNFESYAYEVAEQSFHNRLMEELSNKVNELKGLSGMNLYTVVSEKRTGPASSQHQSRDFFDCLRDGQDEGVLDDIALRLAHVGILNWRTWAAMAYVEE